MKRLLKLSLAPLGAICLLAALVLITSRPGHSAGGAVAVQVTGTTIVSNTDNAARHAVQFELSPSSGSSNTAVDSYTVPAGKRLVIEYITSQLTQYPASGYGYLYFITTVGGSQNYYKVIPPVSSTVPENQVVRIYADPGTTVTAQVTQSSGTSCGGVMNVSGYLVSLP